MQGLQHITSRSNLGSVSITFLPDREDVKVALDVQLVRAIPCPCFPEAGPDCNGEDVTFLKPISCVVLPDRHRAYLVPAPAKLTKLERSREALRWRAYGLQLDAAAPFVCVQFPDSARQFAYPEAAVLSSLSVLRHRSSAVAHKELRASIEHEVLTCIQGRVHTPAIFQGT